MMRIVARHKNMFINIREFDPADALTVNALGLKAFEQFQNAYNDWPAFKEKIAEMSLLAGVGELLVAEIDKRIVGAVVYIGPGMPKSDFFSTRMANHENAGCVARCSWPRPWTGIG